MQRRVPFSSKDKLQDATDKAYDTQDWDTAILGFDALPTPETNKSRFYALGMQSMGRKEYVEALTYFKKAKSIDGVTEKIIEANYYQAVEEFNSANYESALNYFKASKGYGDTADWKNNTNFMIAEEKYRDKDYKAARKLYKALPSGFSFDDVSVANRLKALELCDYFAKYEGTYVGLMDIGILRIQLFPLV